MILLTIIGDFPHYLTCTIATCGVYLPYWYRDYLLFGVPSSIPWCKSYFFSSAIALCRGFGSFYPRRYIIVNKFNQWDLDFVTPMDMTVTRIATFIWSI
jgi:hypothetical protein